MGYKDHIRDLLEALRSVPNPSEQVRSARAFAEGMLAENRSLSSNVSPMVFEIDDSADPEEIAAKILELVDAQDFAGELEGDAAVEAEREKMKAEGNG